MGQMLVVFLVAGCLVGIVGGFVSIFSIRSLSERISALEAQLTGADGQNPASAEQARPPASPATPAPTQRVKAARTTLSRGTAATSESVSRFIAGVRERWMIWLGGLCVALSGIFLARYSMEAGLLGPGGRIALGLVAGFLLLFAAEWLRRRTGKPHPAFAALAGGGSITLFAVLLAALHLYSFLSPGAAFALLALVALATMVLAYLHGPILAAIGMLGAYLVPVMVGSGSGNLLLVLIYSLIICASSLLLLRYVYRPWLWWGMLFGGLGWWYLSLHSESAHGFRGIYLALFAYMNMALPAFDWLLRQRQEVVHQRYRDLLHFSPGASLEEQLPFLSALLVLAQAMSILAAPDLSGAAWQWTPLLLLALVAGGRREPVAAIPWMLLVAQVIALLVSQLRWDAAGHFEFIQLTLEASHALYAYCLVTAAGIVALSLYNRRHSRWLGIWNALLVVGPLLLMTLAYTLTQRLAVNWQWGLLSAAAGFGYLGLAVGGRSRLTVESLAVWLIFGGNLAIALAAMMFTRNAEITLVLSAQVVTTSFIIAGFSLPGLGWVLKLLLSVVIVRLSFNPWLLQYPDDIHWSLWTFGGATACCFMAAYVLRAFTSLARWAEAAGLHLLALTLWSEMRYWLYDGNVFAGEFNAIEAGLIMALFGTLSIVYYRRSLVSQQLAWYYRGAGLVLLLPCLLSYVALARAAIDEKVWLWGSVAETPVANTLLLYFGLPVLLGAIWSRYHSPLLRTPARLFTAFALFFFVSIEIHHLWMGSLHPGESSKPGELYTYSVVWLIMALAAIFAGAWRFGNSVYRAGMMLLLLVIAKLFFVDMSDLSGLLRVASFMGLGLALLCLSYLHQRILSKMLVADGN